MNEIKTKTEWLSRKKMSDVLFVLWAGGAALLSYSLVYALRKPFTAATFDGLDFFGMDYKTATSIIQIAGYFLSKLIGIKVISELKPQNRLKLIVASAAVAELSLVLFGFLPRPFNVLALFFNGLSLGYMWGVIFSFLEGRRVTDLLASIMGVSIAVSSGVARSLGLFVMDTLHISDFWMPAYIGAFAFPLLSLLGWLMTKMPPTLGRGQGFADGTGGHGRTYAASGVPQLYAVVGVALYRQSFCHRAAGHQGGFLSEDCRCGCGGLVGLGVCAD